MADSELPGLVRGCWETPGDEAAWAVLADRLLELGFAGAYVVVVDHILPRVRAHKPVLMVAVPRPDGWVWDIGPGARVLDAFWTGKDLADIENTRLT